MENPLIAIRRGNALNHFNGSECVAMDWWLGCMFFRYAPNPLRCNVSLRSTAAVGRALATKHAPSPLTSMYFFILIRYPLKELHSYSFL